MLTFEIRPMCCSGLPQELSLSFLSSLEDTEALAEDGKLNVSSEEVFYVMLSDMQ